MRALQSEKSAQKNLRGNVEVLSDVCANTVENRNETNDICDKVAIVIREKEEAAGS